MVPAYFCPELPVEPVAPVLPVDPVDPCRAGRPGGQARWLRRVASGVLGDELRDGLRVLADDDVLRHDRAREPAVADRVEHLVLGLPAGVEVRPSHALLGIAALGPGRREGVAAAAALGEELGAAAVDLAPVRRSRPPPRRGPRSR